MRIRLVTMNAMVATLYVVLTTVFWFMSFGQVQFRVSEILNLLIIYDRRFAYGILAGVFLTNTIFMAENGLMYFDLVFGLLHTATALFLAYGLTRLIQGRLGQLVGVALSFALMSWLIALELKLALGLPFWLSYVTVGFGEVVVILCGIPLIQTLDRAVHLRQLLD